MRELAGTTIEPGRHRVPPSAELERELRSEPLWMYRWNLGRGLFAPTHKPEDALAHLHETRLAMMEAEVRRALAAAGPDARVIDLACNEGWFAHRMLDWGAGQVLGVDIRDVNVRRAQLIRDHYGISPERFEVRQGDVYELDPDELGRFDVVLMLGLIYHVEDPMGAVRLTHALTAPGGVCVIESQLTRQDEVEWRAGPIVRQARSSFAVYVEEDAETNPVASGVGILSLIPNLHALAEMPRIAGFARSAVCDPPPDAEPQYINRDRGQVIAWQAGGRTDG